MPNDKRKFCASFSVNIAHGGLRPPSTPQSAAEQSSAASSSTRIRFELSPAPLHGGPEGMYRVRVQRRWLDGKDGSPRYFDKASLAEMLVVAVLGKLPDFLPTPAPNLPCKSPVSVRFERDGWPIYEGTWTSTPPILSHDGRWMVAVHLMGQGTVFVPCEDVVPHPRPRAHKGDTHGRK